MYVKEEAKPIRNNTRRNKQEHSETKRNIAITKITKLSYVYILSQFKLWRLLRPVKIQSWMQIKYDNQSLDFRKWEFSARSPRNPTSSHFAEIKTNCGGKQITYISRKKKDLTDEYRIISNSLCPIFINIYTRSEVKQSN